MTPNFFSRARRALGALLGASAAVLLPTLAHAQVSTTKVMIRTGAVPLDTSSGGNYDNAIAKIRSRRTGIQQTLQSVVPGAFVGRSFNYVGWSVASIPTNFKGDAVKSLQTVFGAQNVAPIYKRRATRVPNDPLYGQQYGLPLINAPVVWDTTTGASNVIVAVLDTGAALSHPDLVPNLYSNGYNAVDPTKSADDDFSPVYHGTHCSGIIGARGNNGIGVSGVCWNVKIIPVKVLGGDGSGTSDTVLGGINYVLQQKTAGVNIRATNFSLGGSGFSQAEYDAFKSLGAAGILNFCAAGNESNDNDGADPNYPSSFDLPSIVAVGASDRNDRPAFFSNYGRTSVDLFAPGVDILSLSQNGGTQVLSGTSMATPMVCGAAALLWSSAQGQNLNALQMKQVLLSTVLKVPALSGLCVTGGRVDLARALALLTPPPPSFTLSGTVYNTNKTQTLAGILVLLSNGLKTTSGADGTYSISGVPFTKDTPTSFTLTGQDVNAPSPSQGYAFPTTPFTYSGPDQGTFSQDLTASSSPISYTILGKVRDLLGKDTSGAAIYLNGEIVPVATSGVAGLFQINDLSQGTYTLSAQVRNRWAYAKVTLNANGTMTAAADADGVVRTQMLGMRTPRVLLQPQSSILSGSASSSATALRTKDPSAPKS